MATKFDPEQSNMILANIYAARFLSKEPAKVIKFIRVNRSYFRSITDESLQAVIKEHNLTEENIADAPEIRLNDIKLQ